MMVDLSAIEFPVSPSPDAAPFWDGLQRGELVVPWCQSCCESFWYPRSLCPRCGSADVAWTAHDGRGVVHAFCIQHQTSLGHLRPLTPFVTALVELAPGVRMMGLLLDVEPSPEGVRCGSQVRLVIVPTAGDRSIPAFVPDPAPPGA
jgi:uncharacterized OB-fold protein